MAEGPETAGTIYTKYLPNDSVLQTDNPVLEPLCFPEEDHVETKTQASTPLTCLLCDRTFDDTGIRKSEALLHHLLVVHQLVIADVDVIADFKSYMHYWKKRFKEASINEFCSVININTKPEDIGPKLQYKLLCDGLPEDKKLREQLQMQKLQVILQCQQQERTDSHFSRNCLFCNIQFEGNRSILFQHMVDNHAFNVGLPDNLVYVKEFLDKLEDKLSNLQCLYCEKAFKDRQTLKDHMRKKQHKKINPKNKEFDKYYIINYLELGKNWHDIQQEDDSEISQKLRDEGWEDWKEESPPVHCLFCEVVLSVTQQLLTHMKESHGFDLLKIKKTQALGFYEEVKIVNYIRRQVYKCKCIFCKEKFASNISLLHHLDEMNHFRLPEEKSCWDQPQYFFPTFENDALLCGLPDDDDDNDVDNDSDVRDVDGSHGNDGSHGDDDSQRDDDCQEHEDVRFVDNDGDVRGVDGCHGDDDSQRDDDGQRHDDVRRVDNDGDVRDVDGSHGNDGSHGDDDIQRDDDGRRHDGDVRGVDNDGDVRDVDGSHRDDDSHQRDEVDQSHDICRVDNDGEVRGIDGSNGDDDSQRDDDDRCFDNDGDVRCVDNDGEVCGVDGSHGDDDNQIDDDVRCVHNDSDAPGVGGGHENRDGKKDDDNGSHADEDGVDKNSDYDNDEAHGHDDDTNDNNTDNGDKVDGRRQRRA